MSPIPESILIAYQIPLAEALAKLNLPEGDEYDVAISSIEGVEVLQIAVTRVRMDGQSLDDLLPETTQS